MTHNQMQQEDFERLQDARKLFRRGYAWIDALGNVGLTGEDFPYEKHVTPADEKANEDVWNYPRWP